SRLKIAQSIEVFPLTCGCALTKRLLSSCRDREDFALPNSQRHVITLTMTKHSASPKATTPLAAITHKGALTISSLLHQLPQNLFRAAARKGRKNAEPADVFRMGWEYVPSTVGYEINIEKVSYATAEGAVAFAALVDYIQANSNTKVRINIDRQSKTWANALQLDQLSKGWLPNFTAPYAHLAGACYVY